MKLSILSTFATSLLIPLSSAAAISSEVTLSYDPVYDNPGLELTKVSCSDGPNGLIPKGYRTAGSLPSFPNIGGVFTVDRWSSPNCGKCYKVSWQGRSVNILAIDRANGFNIAKRAMDTLTNGQAEQLGRIQVSYEEAPASACRM